ncbi:alpha/beta-hydrolase [Viridothelium virens]|uniref:Alpha/beta-hydrolase n=1 Tax=Viridothelium virens TaxID=1048519 RepID=A0A6A6HB11_VIRVR|nr:alpha/beta-hydrolase [Viridothelium virens]
MATQKKESDDVSILGLLPVFLKITLALDYRLLISPFRGTKSKARTYRRDVSYATLRSILSNLSALQGQRLTPSTTQIYERIARARNTTPTSIDLGAGASAHWIGPRSAKHVLLYFHGGGYIAAASPGHMKYQFDLQRALSRSDCDVAILSLSYTLAPGATYPTQLAQAVSALRYLLAAENRAPETVLLGGDSAGGNLACAVLLHLARAHPDQSVEPLELGEGRRLRGAVLISPWVDFATGEESFERNKETDYLSIRALDRASSTFVGLGGKRDMYCHPSEAESEAWRDVAGKVDEILIWGGGGEILIDGIRKFAGIVEKGFDLAQDAGVDKETGVGSKEVEAEVGNGGKEGHREKRVKYVETPRMAHEEMIIDRVLRIKKRERGEAEIESWLSSRL